MKKALFLALSLGMSLTMLTGCGMFGPGPNDPMSVQPINRSK